MRRLITLLRRIDWLAVCGYTAGLTAVVMLYAVTQHFDNQALLIEIASRQ